MHVLKTHHKTIAHAAKILLLLMVSVELYLSLQTFDDVAPIAHLDKLMHFAMHAANAVIAALAFPTLRAYIFALSMLLLLGPLIEVLQYFTPGRDASVLDQLANTVGLIAGAVFSHAVLPRKRSV